MVLVLVFKFCLFDYLVRCGVCENVSSIKLFGKMCLGNTFDYVISCLGKYLAFINSGITPCSAF